MFDNKRFLTCGVQAEISAELQQLMWMLIDTLPVEKDHLQVFKLVPDNGKQKIIHSQEQPEYRKEFVFESAGYIVSAKVYIIDDGDHSTMLLAEEY